MIIVIILGGMTGHSCKKPIYSSVINFPYFDYSTHELFIPTPVDVLGKTVDSIMQGLENKIMTDSGYFYFNRFNDDEETVLAMLQYSGDIWIEGWGDGRFFYRPLRERLENISDYYGLRDWYNVNKDSINWFIYAEQAMEDMGYHLKRDSTGVVYAEPDSTAMHSPLSKTSD